MDTRDILKIVGVAVGIVIWGWSEMRKQAQKKKEQQQRKAAPKQSVVPQRKRMEQSWAAEEEEPVRAERLAASEIVAPSSAEEVGGTVEGMTDMEKERRERVAVDLRTMVIFSELLKPKFEEF